ncbi:hypothetical protein RJ527_14395 [Thalassospiraceae bacterium LMO-SO8]|nr:hypothetical protein [Alphaproteobacteria bacterium LMO-S08]WND75214.1 hypothetical protein RJ527_14395 [Thalassospiraceae bacterium LMO-SO8]
MFLWKALKPQAVLAAFAVLSKEVQERPDDAAGREDRLSTDTPPLRFANSYDPNNLT